VVSALHAGFRSLARSWGLVVLVLLANAGFALVLAIPLALQLEGDLANRGASISMMHGFDYDWWAEWSERQGGPYSALGPGLLGSGFAFRNLDLLLRGGVPAGLFAAGKPLRVDPAILGLGALYLLLQVFLAGGLLGVLRAPGGGWTVRGLAYGAGFYFGRIFRVSLLALAGTGILFAATARRWVDDAARSGLQDDCSALVLGATLSSSWGSSWCTWCPRTPR
jgi:hypothetical protein